ncbi:hypothetical protein POM88_041194 [Heracleum sosnowskyi]|uniref:Uncharacterized protein n=1 Tax=Heracleum sosnowskyi TaxID=360622 RepID=A0AAD8HFF8_9APIA|nr:hypothetical protein POM88_041194 [Heracleum sosnowskyi]
MFTPPKKIFSCWSPRTDPTRKSGSGGGDVFKGKDVVFDEDGLMGRVENTGENMGLKAKLMKLETESGIVYVKLVLLICTTRLLVLVSIFRTLYENLLKLLVERNDKIEEIEYEREGWLSGSELKKVAVFGCPSLSKKAVFSAKILRTFFKIQENMVCCKCVLKQSCKYANQNVWNSNTKNLSLPAVMNVISHYALDSVHPQLIVSDEIKTVVTRLLKVVVKLSQTVS